MPAAYQEVIKVVSNGGIESPTNNMESGRLTSFADGWPHPDNTMCSKLRMARAGFYYTGKGDCVKCFVCRIKLEGWDPEEDEPWQKHLEASPSCDFAKMAKPESHMTVEELMDVFCCQAMHTLDSKLDSLQHAA